MAVKLTLREILSDMGIIAQLGISKELLDEHEGAAGGVRVHVKRDLLRETYRGLGFRRPMKKGCIYVTRNLSKETC